MLHLINRIKFSPVGPIIGGALIGLSTAYNAILFGRVTGISGSLVKAVRLEIRSILFLFGITLTRFVIPTVTATAIPQDVFPAMSVPRIMIAGALVGMGTRLANGCTSGHGVSGLARASKRSLIAVLTFMTTGIITATFTTSASFFPTLNVLLPTLAASKLRLAGLAVLPAILGILSKLSRQNRCPNTVTEFFEGATSTSIGLLFGSGLAVSGMIAPGAVTSFLDIRSKPWDVSLPAVMVSAITVAMLGFQIAKRRNVGFVSNAKVDFPTSNVINGRLIGGAAMFGVGWGLAGICPGPALEYFSVHPQSLGSVCFLSSLVLGSNAITRFSGA